MNNEILINFNSFQLNVDENSIDENNGDCIVCEIANDDAANYTRITKDESFYCFYFDDDDFREIPEHLWPTEDELEKFFAF